MKHPSIFETLRSIQRLPLHTQYVRLGEMLVTARPRSIIRNQIEAARAQIVMRDLKAGNRGLRKRAS